MKGRQRCLWLVKVEKPLPPTMFSYRTFRGDSPIPEARASPIHNSHNRLSVTYCPSLPAVAPATAHPYPFLQYFYRQTITRKCILQRWEQHTDPGTLRYHPWLSCSERIHRHWSYQDPECDAWLSANKQPPSDSTTSTFQHDAPSHAPSYGFRMIPELAIPTASSMICTRSPTKKDPRLPKTPASPAKPPSPPPISVMCPHSRGSSSASSLATSKRPRSTGTMTPQTRSRYLSLRL
ncbi:hypothetical protein EDB86DRAFT_3100714 [Lactarius hatsudake]|nr:hypothetical protein EDB86DRAFT_3100714 [Lactarius hatsudake]